MLLLLENQTENTDGSQDSYELNQSQFAPNYITAVARGTWDGATVTLKFSTDDGTTWDSVGVDTVFTSNGGGNVWLSGKALIRFDLTNAGASTDITAGIL